MLHLSSSRSNGRMCDGLSRRDFLSVGALGLGGLTLAFDHRVADGADAARFVAELARQLSDPNLLLLET